jgi:hypothetical protein
MKQVAFLLVFLCFLFSMPLVSEAVDVNIGIGVALPPLVFAAPPDVVVVPSGESYVYMVPDTPGVYFYGGYWYRFYGDRWYRSDAYNGRWAYVRTSRIPRVIIYDPPDYYRRLPRGYERIHYGDLNRDWRRWDRDRHWNRYDWYKNEVREHEKWRNDRRRSEGGHYRPGRDEHQRGDNVRGPQGDRNRQEGDRQGNDSRRPQDDRRKREGDQSKSQGDNRGSSPAPNQEQGQDRERHEQR